MRKTMHPASTFAIREPGSQREVENPRKIAYPAILDRKYRSKNGP